MKACIRLHKVKQLLNEGANPYSKPSDTNTTAKGLKLTTRTKTSIKRPTIKPHVNHQWSFIDGPAPLIDKVIDGLTCISCKQAIEAVNSVYGKIITNVGSKVIEGLRDIHGVITEYRTVIHFPVFETGYCCKTCFEVRWIDKYFDTYGNVHRGIELLDPPVVKVKEAVTRHHKTTMHSVPETRLIRPSREDALPRGREKVVSVTTVEVDCDGEEVEWVTTLPKAPKNTEPVDPTAYRRVFPARRQIGNK